VADVAETLDFAGFRHIFRCETRSDVAACKKPAKNGHFLASATYTRCGGDVADVEVAAMWRKNREHDLPHRGYTLPSSLYLLAGLPLLL
jgi:hypothetical protein